MSVDFGKYLNRDLMEDFKYFLNKVNERTEFQYGLRESYNDDGNKALGQNVEYFGFNILQDDRMRYIIENIVSIPDNQLSQYNKIGNTIISHFYGVRNIHNLVTGESDPKKAHFDFERAAVDQDYIDKTSKIMNFYRHHKEKFYDTTALHTSIQTAARNYCRQKYGINDRQIELTDILEWVASWIKDGTMDRIIGEANSLKDMYGILTEKRGIGPYYGYHCGTSNSVNPILNFSHEDLFCAPGPGALEAINMLFPNLPKTKNIYGDVIVWLHDNQQELFHDLKIHEYFHNYKIEESNVFKNNQNFLTVYGLEVCLCQYSVYNYLRNNEHLIGRRQVFRSDTSSLNEKLIDYMNGDYILYDTTKRAKQKVTSLF